MTPDMERKIKKALEALAGELKPGSVTHVSIKHDTGCPAIRTQRLADCTCDDPDIEKVGQC